MTTYLKNHWLQCVLVGLTAALMIWAGGCPPRTPSPIDPSKQMTLPQLNVELEHLVKLYELAEADIREQQRIRTLILSNALLIAESGTINPLGLLTAAAGAYGLASASTSAVKRIKKVSKPPTP